MSPWCHHGNLNVLPVDFKRANDLLCLTSVELVVRERFGSKAHRIFRLIHAKKLLEQNKVAELAMLPGKEAKEILYTLLAESFLCLQVSYAHLIFQLPADHRLFLLFLVFSGSATNS